MNCLILKAFYHGILKMRRRLESQISLKSRFRIGCLALFLVLLSVSPSRAAPGDFPEASRPDNGALLAHARRQMLKAIPAKTLLSPLRFVGDEWRRFERTVGFSDFLEESAVVAAPVALFASLWRPGVLSGISGSFWLEPGYRHVGGIMPWHDSVLLGFHYQRNLVDNRVRLHVNPYYGMGWSQGGNLWGTKADLSFGAGGDRQPWGTLSVRFDGGDPALNDYRRGYDLSGAVRLNDHLSLNIGARARENDTQGGYAMLRWRWGGDFLP
jgi:hypothetical protein